MKQKGTSKNNGKKFHGDEEFRQLSRLQLSQHTVLILIFIIATMLSFFGIYYFQDPDLKQIALGFAISFATATIVDFVYNYVAMKDVEEMVAKHLMLNRDVQKKILKDESVNEILSTSLETLVGQKFATAIKKSVIDEIAAEKDLLLRDRANYSVYIRNSTEDLLKNYFETEITSIFNMKLESDTVTFYATDSEKIYRGMAKKINNPDFSLCFYLPEGTGKLLKSNDSLLEHVFSISQFSIDGIVVKGGEYEKQYEDEGNITIKIKFKVPTECLNKIGKTVRVVFRQEAILSKYEHYFFFQEPTAYPNFNLQWDCTQADIEQVETLVSFIGVEPEIIRQSKDGKRIKILMEELVFPHNVFAFIWRLKGEKQNQ